MLSDKEVKKQFKKEASQQPDMFYATSVLKEEGFMRKQCKTCQTFFWTQNQDQEVCGDASCQGGFTFLDNNPSQHTLYYAQVWQKFSELFEKEGYSSINRFPVVARWNPTTDFTIASIAAFQPFVVSGEAKPPAKKLVIPQFCLRFGDLANVGVTMSHLTGFVMIGQHQFVNADEWNQNKAFKEILNWLTQGLGLDKKDITFHEDAWAGGGNFGPCMEFFSRGVELGNQVYMMYEQIEAESGRKELDIKVLDMGMGMERNAWFSQGAPTIYDATFPDVIRILVDKTGVSYDEEFIRSYVPYGAYLNLDEVEDMTSAWNDVAKQMNISVDVLKEKLYPMTAIYSIAEHARSLLFALCDGGLPSNVGGGYNLRVILRRALGFIKEFSWDIDLADVCEWHANELENIFPELKASMNDVRKIINFEKIKFIQGHKRNKEFIKQVLKKGIPSTQDLLLYYESKGISPEEFVKAQKEILDEKSNTIHSSPMIVPENFYLLLANRQEENQQEQQVKTNKLHLLGIDESLPATQIMYYDDWQIVNFEAKVLQIIDGKDIDTFYVILDKTSFYPTSGGQIHDKGFIGGGQLIDCIKQGKFILHLVKNPDFEVGDIVKATVDVKRRTQLTQHHTATHIINGSAREILGNHIWQAGASKSLEKARLDITHFDALSQETLGKIEARANEIIKENIPISKLILPRDEAEKEFGFRLSPGGAVPGNEIRVVSIPGIDTEACGGTHLNNTGEAIAVKILKSTKIQDGVVRIEFVAGEAALKESNKDEELLNQASSLLNCSHVEIPGRCEELFSKWKKAKKKKLSIEDFPLTSSEKFSGDILSESANILKTQPEHVVKTIKKFLSQLEDLKKKIE